MFDDLTALKNSNALPRHRLIKENSMRINQLSANNLQIEGASPNAHSLHHDRVIRSNKQSFEHARHQTIEAVSTTNRLQSRAMPTTNLTTLNRTAHLSYDPISEQDHLQLPMDGP